uniref:Alpha/beta-Hydrolases superfamily protein n=1 Tax=Rhizophora mucronata TaxID=61149 RepID=A0A2P2IVR8_RHIMU
MLLRLFQRPRRFYRLPLPRSFCSSSSSSANTTEPSDNLKNHNHVPPPSPVLRRIPLVTTTTGNLVAKSSLCRTSLVALSATLLSAMVASYAVLSTDTGAERNPNPKSNSKHVASPLYAAIDHAISSSNDSIKRIFHHFRQTGVAASVLWQSLRSVLSSANHEVRVGFELRVAALLADIAAVNAARRAALVGAGGGKVVDWLLETVAVGGDGCGTQAEAARALAFLIADPNVSAEVLGRPHAVPYLLRFIFSCQPKNKHSRRGSFSICDSLKGRSMLVAAIMDIVTSNCDSLQNVSFKPSLPGNAEMRDIAAAIEVVEEGGLHMDKPPENEEDDDGGRGMKGIGIKILEGTTTLGLSRTSGIMKLDQLDANREESHALKTLALLHKHDGLQAQANLSSAVVPGLWDDLHCQHVAVPFAAWALANWAMASDVNRSHIQELDQDGQAVMTALVAPERSVKWHGSLVARLLLEDRNLPLNDSVSDWSSSLLNTVSQASKNEDLLLAQVALSAFLLSVERSPGAQKLVMERGLQLMRDTAKQTTKHGQVQEMLAKALELLSSGEMHFSLEESEKWSGILLPWACGKGSTDMMRSSAKNILSRILEVHGPLSVAISQGWLAMLLNEVLVPSKVSSVKGGTQPKSDKVKSQIDQSNNLSATQAASQLAVSVVNLAGNQLGTTLDSAETFPLEDFLSLEPLAGAFKNLKKDSIPKFNVADSALATLKAIKALTELCYDDSLCQENIAAFGVLCLLRRFLLCDDYEKLAAMEAYDASRALEAKETVVNPRTESSNGGGNDPSSVRVPPTGHIRRHAARLLTVLSVLPKVQKAILADENWFRWLEDCANGKIPGCRDLKIQSYARATLLNVICNEQSRGDSLDRNVPKDGITDRNSSCACYSDMIYLISPELPHWKHCERLDSKTVRMDKLSSSEADSGDAEGSPVTSTSNVSNRSNSANESQLGSDSGVPLLDVVFVHGLRGGPFKTWRLADDKTSTKSGLVEKIDEEAGKLGTFWPGEWLSSDFPQARLFTLKYKVCSNIDGGLRRSLPANYC